MVDGDVAHLGILHARNVAYFAVGKGRLYGAVEQAMAYGQHRLIVIHLIYIGNKTLGTLKHGLYAFGIVGHLTAAGYGDGSAGKTPPIALAKQGAGAERQMQSAIDDVGRIERALQVARQHDVESSVCGNQLVAQFGSLLASACSKVAGHEALKYLGYVLFGFAVAC